MIIILFYFINNYERIKLKYKSYDLLEYVYTLEYGEYSYKTGVIFKDNNVINSDYYINGTGKIIKDEYNNVKLYIKTDKYCISKTSLGHVIINRGKCESIDNIKASYIKNNTQVSFNIINNLEYMISDKNDMNSSWKKEEYEDNLILYFYENKTYYIWFKDEHGNITDTIKLKVDCFNTTNSEYNNKLFYCSGSILSIDKVKWIVLNDSKNEITLMKYLPLEEKMSQCTDYESEYCYYTKDLINEYKWSNSKINYYLNNIYIEELNSTLKNNLVNSEICDDTSLDSICDSSDSCVGYLKSEINQNNWKCESYTTSKIRLITYLEYKNNYNNINDNELILDDYWSLSAGERGYGSSIQENTEYYIKENLLNELNIKPVITMYK